MRHIALLALAVLFVPRMTSHAAEPELPVIQVHATASQPRPTEPWPGPKGEFVFVEAESFAISDKAWSVVQTPHGFYAHVGSAMKSVLGAGKGGEVLRHDIVVPQAGEGRLWVRFSQSRDTTAKQRGPFHVAIEQGGKVAAQRVFDENEAGIRPTSGIRGVPFVWDSLAATLTEGAATLTFTTIGRTPSASVRMVDCVLFTTDTAYQPDERDFAPQTYVRLRLNTAVPERVYFYNFIDHLRAPWSRNTFFSSTGWRDGVNAPKQDYLTAGGSTPWVNISRLLYTGCDTLFNLQATVAYHNPDASASDYELDFATAPVDAAIVKTVRRAGAGAGMQVRVPEDLTHQRVPKADYEFAAARAAFITKLEPPRFGKLPEKFPLLVAFDASDLRNTPSVRIDELSAMRFLGINGIQRTLDERDARDGLRHGIAHARIWFMGPARYNEPLLDKIEAGVTKGGADLKANRQYQAMLHTQLMDEAVAKELNAMVADPVDQRCFVEWLRAQGLAPESLGIASWKSAKLTADRSAQPPELYYYSQRFRAWSVANFFRIATEQVRRHYPTSAPATQNFSDGAVYQANFYAQGNDYFTWFNNRALDAAFSEDWSNGAASFQTCGWNVALLRAATRKHRQPIHMYCIASYGRRPLDVKLKSLTDISEGAKMLAFFSYTPQYAGHELGWAENLAMFPALAELTREIGAAEDVLLDAMPRRAETAILYSTAHDIWSAGVDNTHGHERMHTWLALRHAQVPVDIIGDEDARDGQLDGRKAIYLYGEQLDARNVAPLAKWVRAGGTLVLGPDAGSRDEFNRPGDALDAALGIARSEGRTLQQVWHSGSYICTLLKPKGQVTIGNERVDLLAHSQPIEASTNSEVLAQFEDGKPAAVMQTVGKGRVVQQGFMPALAYIRSAYLRTQEVRNTTPATQLPAVAKATALLEEGGFAEVTGAAVSLAGVSAAPIHYSGGLRNYITGPARAAKVNRPVELNTPQIEAAFMEGKRGWVIPLANYSGAPQKEIALTIRTGKPFGKIRSSRGGILKPTTNKDGSITVALPLESTDFVYANWNP